jgi:tetratricopeptide (TPR) repeat protein
MILSIAGSIYLLYLNFRSLQLQALVKYEITKGELLTPSAVFMSGFPAIPTMSVESEPVALMKARYLINEGKLMEAIEILKNDKSSPWETRRELFISRAYMDLGNSDSALIYSRRVYELKPTFRDNIDLLLTILDQKAQYGDAVKVLDEYLSTGITDGGLMSQRAAFDLKAKIQRVEAAWYMGKNMYERKNYAESAKYFTEVIMKEPDLTEAYDYRAFCWFNLKEYRKSLADVEYLLSKGNKDARIISLREQLKVVTK